MTLSKSKRTLTVCRHKRTLAPNGDWIWQTLNVEDCDPCKVTNTSLEKASISIYPNPSDGYLFLENYSNKSLSVRIEKIDGVTLNHLLLEQGQKTQIDHLPPGVLVAEITDQDGKQLRKMIVIIK